MTTKPVFSALGAPMSPAWVHGSPRVEELALPKSLKSCNFTLAKVVIRWMSVKMTISGATESEPDSGYLRLEERIHLKYEFGSMAA